jgi:hypothetical protein
MTRKHWMLVTTAIILLGVSLYLNKDWFAPKPIHFFVRMLSQRAGNARHLPQYGPVDPVLFGFSEPLLLSSVKVVMSDDAQTNRFPTPIWHLISESNSVPVREFFYGDRLRNMHPAVKTAAPLNLQPGVNYRLLLEGGKFKGEYEFTPRATTG